MSGKDKLIELIRESTGCTYHGDVVVEEEIDIGEEEILRIANHLIENGVMVLKAEPVVHCKNCAFFDEYSKHPERYLYTVEGADGVCFLRRLNSDKSQFHARRFEDFCSDGEKDNDE